MVRVFQSALGVVEVVGEVASVRVGMAKLSIRGLQEGLLNSSRLQKTAEPDQV
jgi:hypothetical protein